MIGGVAGGLGRYFGVDPVFFRVAFVALTVFGGAGLALYAAGWFLVPEEGEDRSIAARALATDGPNRTRVLRVLVAVFVAVALFNLVFAGPWWPNSSWAPGGVALVATAIAVALIASSRGSAGTRSAGRLVGWLLATMAALSLIALSGVIALVAVSDAPLRGGIGDRHWRPVATSEVRPAYRLAIGDMAVDLSDVRFGSGTTRVAASVGVGHLLLRVPSDVPVSVPYPVRPRRLPLRPLPLCSC